MNMYYWLSILLVIYPLASKADLNITCGSEQDCGKVSRDIGGAIAGVAALIVPHAINNGEFSKGAGRLGVSIGQKSLKEFDLNLQSSLTEEKRFLIFTELRLQIFDNQTPSTIQYAIGSGYNYKIADNFLIQTNLGFAAEKIESLEAVQMASELDLFFDYMLKDQIGFFVESKSMFFSESVYKINAGCSYRYFHNSPPITISIGYEDNRLIEEKYYSLKLGFKL